MKKIFLSVLSLAVCGLLLASCGGKKTAVDETKVLKDETKAYFAAGPFSGWGDCMGNDEFRLKPIALNNEHLTKEVKDVLIANKVKSLQMVELYLAANGDHGQDVKVNQADENVDNEEDYDYVPSFWAQNKESGEVYNLTSSTLFMPKYRETDTDGDGLGTWGDNPYAKAEGTYYLVFAELGKVGFPTYAMGLIPSENDLKPETPVIEYTYAYVQYAGDALNCYSFDAVDIDNKFVPAWPGQAAEKVADTTNLWKVKVVKGATKLIFNNSVGQTENITIDSTKGYYVVEDAATALTATAQAEVFEGLKTTIEFDVKAGYLTDGVQYYAWFWGGEATGWFAPVTVTEGKASFVGGLHTTGFLLLYLKDGQTEPSWDNKENQTNDCTIANGVVNLGDWKE